jgi:hypothetical protein
LKQEVKRMKFNRFFTPTMCFAPDDGGAGGQGGASGEGTGGGGGTGAGTGAGAAAAGDGAVALPKTVEELNSLIAVKTDEALKSSQEKWQKDFDEKLKNDTAEAARMAKLTADEREKELEKKRQEDLDKRESTIKLQELKLKATDMLTSKGLPLEIRDMVIGQDEADTTARITAFEGVFQKAVEAAVNQKLAGSARPGAGNAGTETDPIRASFANAIRA